MNGTSPSLCVAVIGGGLVGTAAAEWLRRDGHDVTLIDRGPPEDAASYGNGGVLARCAVVPVPVPGILFKAPGMLFDPDQPLFLRWSYLPKLMPWLVPYLATSRREKVVEIASGLAGLLTDAVDQHVALARGTPAERWIEPGDYIYLYRDEAAFEADGFGWSLRRDHGIVGERMNRGDLTDYDPALSPRYDFGCRLTDHGTITDPGRYVADLRDWFAGQGGRVVEADVDDVQPGPDTVRISYAGQTLEADRAVIACGAWSKRLAGKLGHRIKLESERGYHIRFLEASPRPKCPYMVADAKFVATPMADGVRVAGVVEFGGLEAAPSRGPEDLLERGIKFLYPDFAYAEKHPWMGHRPAPADSLPYLGASPKHPSVYFAFGHHHVGLTAGPKSGRLVADMISGRLPNIDTAAYRVDRFD